MPVIRELPAHILYPDPKIYWEREHLTIDFETTIDSEGNSDPIRDHNHIVCGAVKLSDQQTYIKDKNELHWSEEVTSCEEADFIIAHNAKFELQWLRRAGLNLTRVVVFDTMIADYVLAGNRPWRLDLNSCLQRRGLPTKGNYISNSLKNKICPSMLPASLVHKYCIRDVDLTYQLFLRQREELDKAGLLNTFYTHCLLTPVLADVEFSGIHLDEDNVKETFTSTVYQYTNIMSELDKMTGGINPNSSDQVADFVYNILKFPELKDRSGKSKRNKPSKRWPDGKPLTSIDTILSLKATTKTQKKFIELKKQQSVLNAEITKALSKFNLCVQEKKLLHATLNQTRTQTHRLSSSGRSPFNVQFQNIKRSHKKFITPRKEGWVVKEVDFAKLEFNVAAFISQDPQAMDDIINNFDVHRYSAAVMKFGKDKAKNHMEEITKEERNRAKPDTFKPLYYGKSGTPEQMEYYAAFRAKYPVLNKMQEEWINTVLRTGSLTTLTGLTFYWPDTKMTKSGFVTNSNSICNYPVQNLATSEISSIGTIYLWHRMKLQQLQSFIINVVHDSAWSEIHPDEQEIMNSLMNQAFINDVYFYLKEVYDIDYNLPITIEISGGESL